MRLYWQLQRNIILEKFLTVSPHSSCRTVLSREILRICDGNSICRWNLTQIVFSCHWRHVSRWGRGESCVWVVYDKSHCLYCVVLTETRLKWVSLFSNNQVNSGAKTKAADLWGSRGGWTYHLFTPRHAPWAASLSAHLGHSPWWMDILFEL